MRLRRLLTLASLASLASASMIACSGGMEPPPTIEPDPDDPCPLMFQQHWLPDYYVDISAEEWAKLDDEFRNRPAREAAGLETKPWHPIQFRMGNDGAQIPNVMIRLKGASSWLQTIQLDANPKMQFVIAFNEIVPEGRFHGVRKIELDMPRTDHTFVRHRLGLYQLRQAGIPAQCANNARLFINGEYYGLYTNLERPDKEWLQRIYPEADDDDGDLWESGRIIKTNEETFTWDRAEMLWHGVQNAEELSRIADLPASMQAWAAEATIGDADGYYNGRANFFIYDHPRRGFIWLPTDIDTAWDRDFLPYDASLTHPQCVNRWERDWTHFLMVVNDPVWVEEYITAVADMRDRFDPAHLETMMDAFEGQTRLAAQADPRRPFDMSARDLGISMSREYIRLRARSIDDWLRCRGGDGADADGDGFMSCFECDDHLPDVKPGAPEVCNGRDDNCDGRTDNMAGGAACM